MMKNVTLVNLNDIKSQTTNEHMNQLDRILRIMARSSLEQINQFEKVVNGITTHNEFKNALLNACQRRKRQQPTYTQQNCQNSEINKQRLEVIDQKIIPYGRWKFILVLSVLFSTLFAFGALAFGTNKTEVNLAITPFTNITSIQQITLDDFKWGQVKSVQIKWLNKAPTWGAIAGGIACIFLLAAILLGKINEKIQRYQQQKVQIKRDLIGAQ